MTPVLAVRGATKRFGVTPDLTTLGKVALANGEYAQAEAEHRPTKFCPPKEDKPRVSKEEYLAAANAVPVDKRASTDTKDVLRTVLEHKYPCAS